MYVILYLLFLYIILIIQCKRDRNFKALLIIYLTVLSKSLKMASSKPKHVAMFS
jgi:hypothetical protein